MTALKMTLKNDQRIDPWVTNEYDWWLQNALGQMTPKRLGPDVPYRQCMYYVCRSPNWNEPHTTSGTPRFGILTNPYPNQFGESPFQYGDCFFGVFFSVTHKIGLFSPKITSKNREHTLLFNYIMNMVHHSIILLWCWDWLNFWWEKTDLVRAWKKTPKKQSPYRNGDSPNWFG